MKKMQGISCGTLWMSIDDVWSTSFIDKFPSQIKGCKILITSTIAFPNYNVFRLDPLSDEDAGILFRQLAFMGGESTNSQTIGDRLVNQIIRYCDKHRMLALSVVGNILRGKDELQWRAMLNILSQGKSFSSGWCNMKVPKVEVLGLNLMTKNYTLPHFLEEMQKLKIKNVTNYGLHPTNRTNFYLLCCLSNLTRIRLEHVVIPSSCESFLELANLQKVSFIMCKIGNCFEKRTSDHPQVWPGLVELEIDYCKDLVEFPRIFCKSAHLKNLSVTNCNKMCVLSEELGNLTSLETLSLHSCTKLEKLPESISKLQKLSILDVSDCLSLSKFPEQIGKLADLRTIYM